MQLKRVAIYLSAILFEETRPMLEVKVVAREFLRRRLCEIDLKSGLELV